MTLRGVSSPLPAAGALRPLWLTLFLSGSSATGAVQEAWQPPHVGLELSGGIFRPGRG